MLIKANHKFFSADNGGNGGTPEQPRNREGFVACTLGLHQGSHGTFSKVVNVAGRVALVAGAVVGTMRLFMSGEEEAAMPEAVGAYEPQ